MRQVVALRTGVVYVISAYDMSFAGIGIQIPTNSGLTDWKPDFVRSLRSWHKDPMWQNLNLFPWMGDEWALRLSEVYTRLEMETFTGKLHERHTKSLGDYWELFIDITPEGTRIQVKGDPGIGKTTFTHKIAYDWATGNLPQFDVVLVLKLKFINKHQTIEKYGGGSIEEYLRQSRFHSF